MTSTESSFTFTPAEVPSLAPPPEVDIRAASNDLGDILYPLSQSECGLPTAYNLSRNNYLVYRTVWKRLRLMGHTFAAAQHAIARQQMMNVWHERTPDTPSVGGLIGMDPSIQSETSAETESDTYTTIKSNNHFDLEDTIDEANKADHESIKDVQFDDRPLADGPCKLQSWCHNGMKFEQLQRTPWCLVNFLWSRLGNWIDFSDLADPVYGDREEHITTGSVRSASSRANKFFKDNKIPLQVEIKSQQVRLIGSAKDNPKSAQIKN